MKLLGNKTIRELTGRSTSTRFVRWGVLFFLLLLGIIVVGFCLIPDRKTIRVVAFGDSITATRKGVDQVFAQRLPNLVEEEFMLEIINAGVGSSHSGTIHDNAVAKVQHGRDRFEEGVLAQNPDLVIIGFGTNDAYIDSKVLGGASRISLDQYRDNLVYMITELQKRKIRVILMAPNPLSAPRPEFQSLRLYEYVRVVRALAIEYHTGLADNYRLFIDYGRTHGGYASLLLDGVHPNDEGHRLIAENLATQTLKVIKEDRF